MMHSSLMKCVNAVASLLLSVAALGPATAATGSQACALCHPKIFDSYMRTSMARSSGAVSVGAFRESFDKGEFSHVPSGVRYRVYRDADDTLFQFAFVDNGLKIQGSRRLDFFIGSGRVGRSYLFSRDGFLYQAPVSYYSTKSKWDLSPGFEDYDRLHLTRPVEPTCLQCHASQVRPLVGTVNGYSMPAFLEGGVGCERCHGPGEGHIAKAKAGDMVGGTAIVNPRKLSPDRRDSVCAECHAAGVARIDKAGTRPGDFQPGALLRDYVATFVWSGVNDMNVTSHVEKLARSRCKIASGDRLWCGSCHDPHSEPAEVERAAYFRNKCLECHTATAPCKAAPSIRAEKADRCTDCHMPKNAVVDVTHASYTDHSIPRLIRNAPVQSPRTDHALVLLGSDASSDRDLGMAYALVLESGRNTVYEARAFELLKAAVARQSGDVLATVRLAQLYGYRGDDNNAVAFYRKALAVDPTQVVAATNLGVYLMKQGQMKDAIALWSGALARSPGLEAARNKSRDGAVSNRRPAIGDTDPHQGARPQSGRGRIAQAVKRVS